jgi:MFS family permease
MSTGIVSAMFAVGTAVGLVLGAWITDNFGWWMTYDSLFKLVLERRQYFMGCISDQL